MYQLMSDLPYERILIAVSGGPSWKGAGRDTQLRRERKAFGQSIFKSEYQVQAG
jgi:hypothetical protein